MVLLRYLRHFATSAIFCFFELYEDQRCCYLNCSSWWCKSFSSFCPSDSYYLSLLLSSPLVRNAETSLITILAYCSSFLTWNILQTLRVFLPRPAYGHYNTLLFVCPLFIFIFIFLLLECFFLNFLLFLLVGCFLNLLLCLPFSWNYLLYLLSFIYFFLAVPTHFNYNIHFDCYSSFTFDLELINSADVCNC